VDLDHSGMICTAKHRIAHDKHALVRRHERSRSRVAQGASAGNTFAIALIAGTCNLGSFARGGIDMYGETESIHHYQVVCVEGHRMSGHARERQLQYLQ
jgi:hypothetical protein